MDENLKKLLATAVATGAIVSAATLGISEPNCDYVFATETKQVCLTTEEAEVLAERLSEVKAGFGSNAFGGGINILEKK